MFYFSEDHEDPYDWYDVDAIIYMKVGESRYTVPWAFCADIHSKRMYVRKGYGTHANSGGTCHVLIKRLRKEIFVVNVKTFESDDFDRHFEQDIESSEWHIRHMIPVYRTS